MANIALLPGGFKPPHAGHYAVAKYLSQKSGAEVLVRVGAKERDGITQDMSIDIWKLYGVNAEEASSDSPIADVFKYVEEKATEKDNLHAKIRYRAKDTSCKIIDLNPHNLEVEFEQPCFAIAPGQSIVFYDKDICLGGAIIESYSN